MINNSNQIYNILSKTKRYTKKQTLTPVGKYTLKFQFCLLKLVRLEENTKIGGYRWLVNESNGSVWASLTVYVACKCSLDPANPLPAFRSRWSLSPEPLQPAH